jgi:hypothetical protein
MRDERKTFPWDDPKHPAGTCAGCGEEMIWNVPRLGPDGGYIHKSTGLFLCKTSTPPSAAVETPEASMGEVIAEKLFSEMELQDFDSYGEKEFNERKNLQIQRVAKIITTLSAQLESHLLGVTEQKLANENQRLRVRESKLVTQIKDLEAECAEWNRKTRQVDLNYAASLLRLEDYRRALEKICHGETLGMDAATLAGIARAALAAAKMENKA